MVRHGGQAVAAPASVAQFPRGRRLGLLARVATVGQREPVAGLERAREAAVGFAEVEVGGDPGVGRRLVGGVVGDEPAVGQRPRILVDDERAGAGTRDQRALAALEVAVAPEFAARPSSGRLEAPCVRSGWEGEGIRVALMAVPLDDEVMAPSF